MNPVITQELEAEIKKAVKRFVELGFDYEEISDEFKFIIGEVEGPDGVLLGD